MIVFKKAFTLVELLVVVTLILILGTIAFIYFESSIWEARDAKRKGDMLEIVNVLELYHTEKWSFPVPDEGVNITYSGAVAWTQGTFGTQASRAVKVFWIDYPKDPLHENEYTYSTTNNGNEFQLASIRETLEEEEGLWEIALSPMVSSAYAGNIETAFIMGDYNGFMVKARSGAIDYYIATPSIVTNDITDTDIISILTNQKLVFHEFFNLPHSYSPHMSVDAGFNFNVTDPIIFSGSTNDLKSEDNLLEFDSKLKYIYATTPTESFDRYISVLEKEWLTSLKWFLDRKFKVNFKTYFNCKDILDAWNSEWDGSYTIDPDGPWWADAYNVYCDMTTDGWWWTRVGDNHITNGNFASGTGVVWAYENAGETNEIVALSTWVDGNNYALHQTGNYSSYYQVTFDDPSVLRPWYEIRMSMWRSDYGSWAVDEWSSNTKILAGKSNYWTPWTCTSHPTSTSCRFSYFNTKMAYAPNFWPWGLLTEIPISIVETTDTITTSYLEWWILFDGYIPQDIPRNSSLWYIDPYTSTEMDTINDWVEAWGFLLSTNDEGRWDPLWEYYGMPSWDLWDNVSKYWEIANIDHPLVNGDIWLEVDLRWQTLIWEQAYSWLTGTPEAGDIILARDKYSPYLPTVILRKHGKWHLLITSDEWIFRNMSTGNTFNPNDNEDAFAAAIMAYAIETAAGINPHEWYVFHNRIHYNDGTFSTNGEDKILETIVVDDGWEDRVWTKEQTRHRIYKTPESFDWYIGLDANNNKDLYFTGLRLELFYR